MGNLHRSERHVEEVRRVHGRTSSFHFNRHFTIARFLGCFCSRSKPFRKAHEEFIVFQFCSGRALLAEGAEAERWYAEALRLHAEGNRPFDRARTELAYGEYLRRERRRTDAREQLRAALTAFEHLRADPWAERARGELRATGETVRKRDPSTIDELTPQELQIARFVSEGLSNKEVAAQLFISSRTVEYHLRKVFAKLGIASRAELIRDGVPALA